MREKRDYYSQEKIDEAKRVLELYMEELERRKLDKLQQVCGVLRITPKMLIQSAQIPIQPGLQELCYQILPTKRGDELITKVSQFQQILSLSTTIIQLYFSSL